MIKFKKGTAKLFLDILGLMYTSLKADGLEESVRKIANAGFDGIRFFNCKKDSMKFEDYNDAYWRRFRLRLKYLKKYNLIPIISASGYYRVNKHKFSQEQWIGLFQMTLDEARGVFPKDDFIIEIANEPKIAPNKFTWTPKKGGMPGKMQRVGMWHQVMSQVLVDKGFPRKQIMGNGIDDENYPKVPSTADMIIAGVAGDIFDEANKNIKDVFSAWHNILFKEDITANTGAKRMYIARRLWKYYLTNDGGSAAGLVGNGHTVGCPTRNKYPSINGKELFEISREVFRLAKNGISGHQITVWYSDLPREYFQYTDTCKLYFDLRHLDWERLDNMVLAYQKVFGKFPPNFGQHKKPEPKPEPEPIPEPPKPEPEPPKPIPPKEEEISMWDKIKGFLGLVWQYWKMTPRKAQIIIIGVIFLILFIMC